MTQEIISGVACFFIALFATLLTRGKLDRKKNGNGEKAKPTSPELPWDETPLELPASHSRASDDWRIASHWDEIIAIAATIVLVFAVSYGMYCLDLNAMQIRMAKWSPARAEQFKIDLWWEYISVGFGSAVLGFLVGVWEKIQGTKFVARTWKSLDKKAKKELVTFFTKFATTAGGLLVLYIFFGWLMASIPWPFNWILKFGWPILIIIGLFKGGGLAWETLQTVLLFWHVGGAKGKKEKEEEDPDEKKEKAEKKAISLRTAATKAETDADEAEATRDEARKQPRRARAARDAAKTALTTATPAGKAATETALEDAEAAVEKTEDSVNKAESKANRLRRAAERADDEARRAERDLSLL